MSQQNVKLVRELLEAFQRRDHERAFDFYDPDIVWEDHGDAEFSGVYHGHDGVRAYWREWLSAWRDLQFEIQDVRDVGDEVVALIDKQRQWGRHSGIETEMPPYGIVFTIRAGKVVRWRVYFDQESALQAAGRSRTLSADGSARGQLPPEESPEDSRRRLGASAVTLAYPVT